MQGIIKCQTLGSFVKIAAALAVEQVCFEADADALTITLNGGY